MHWVRQNINWKTSERKLIVHNIFAGSFCFLLHWIILNDAKYECGGKHAACVLTARLRPTQHFSTGLCQSGQTSGDLNTKLRWVQWPPGGLSVSWMWPKVDILLEGSFANLPRLIPKLEGANVVCAGACLTTPAWPPI